MTITTTAQEEKAVDAAAVAATKQAKPDALVEKDRTEQTRGPGPTDADKTKAEAKAEFGKGMG